MISDPRAQPLRLHWFISLPLAVCNSCEWVKVTQSCLTLCHPMDVACQASLSMEFSRPEYWRGLPFPSPGDLPNPGIEARSPALQVDSLPSETSGKQIMKTNSKQSRHSFDSLARFRVPFNTTFPNGNKGLLGIPSNRCCRAHSRGFCHTNSDRCNVTRALDTQEGGHQGSAPSGYPWALSQNRGRSRRPSRLQRPLYPSLSLLGSPLFILQNTDQTSPPLEANPPNSDHMPCGVWRKTGIFFNPHKSAQHNLTLAQSTLTVYSLGPDATRRSKLWICSMSHTHVSWMNK